MKPKLSSRFATLQYHETKENEIADYDFFDPSSSAKNDKLDSKQIYNSISTACWSTFKLVPMLFRKISNVIKMYNFYSNFIYHSHKANNSYLIGLN